MGPPPSWTADDRAAAAGAPEDVDPVPVTTLDGQNPVGTGVSDVLHVMEERLAVSKRRRTTGRLRISLRTERLQVYAEGSLDSNSAKVTRVAVGRVVDSLPPVRTDGNTTIVPIVEERFVVVKQLFLREELHISQTVTRQAFRRPVDLRRQRAIVERFDKDGRPVKPDEP